MILNRLAAVLCGAAFIATGAAAQEITGGSLGLSYSAFTDESDFARTALEGSIEFGFTREFAAQLDLGAYRFNDVDETGTNATLHGIYHMNDATSFGVFYGQDDFESSKSDFYGIEVGHEFQSVDVEAYYARQEDDAEDADAFGLAGRYAVSDAFGLTAEYETIQTDSDLDFSRTSVGVDYMVGNGLDLYAAVGSAKVEAFGDSGSEGFFEIGGRYTFGAERGATFGKRGLLQMLPGL